MAITRALCLSACCLFATTAAVLNPDWSIFNILDIANVTESLEILQNIPISRYWDTEKAEFRVGILPDIIGEEYSSFITNIPKSRVVNRTTVFETINITDTPKLLLHMINVLQSLSSNALFMSDQVNDFIEEKNNFALKIIRIAQQTGKEWRTAEEIKASRYLLEKRRQILNQKLENEKALHQLRLNNIAILYEVIFL
jgi:hypothetical protein